MSRLPGALLYHVVMDASAHKGIDYVNGYFGPQARIDRRALQLRWLNQALWSRAFHSDAGRSSSIPSGRAAVDVPAPLDIFVIGDNMWRKEREWLTPLREGFLEEIRYLTHGMRRLKLVTVL